MLIAECEICVDKQFTVEISGVSCLISIFYLSNLKMMIKRKSYFVIAFFYRKANILCRGVLYSTGSYGNKGLCHCCRSH